MCSTRFDSEYDSLCHFPIGVLGQGRRRLLESGTAIGHRWCSPSANSKRGGGEDERGVDPPHVRGGGLGDLPQENFVIQDD